MKLLLLLLLLGKVGRELGNLLFRIAAAKALDLQRLGRLHEGPEIGLGHANLTPVNEEVF